MGSRIHHYRRVLVLLTAVALVIVSCGDHSVYDLLGSQQQGAFKLAQQSIETVTGAQYALTATGGYTEYSFTMHSGPGEVSAGGTYTAPSSITTGENVAIVTATDRVGSSDSAEIKIHERLTVTPLSTTVPIGDDYVELDVEITGGIGDVTVVSNTLEPNKAEIVDGKIRYTPTKTGKDYIELSDEYGSSSVVTVTVYDPDMISIDPTSAIVVAGETVEFTVHCSSSEFTVEIVPESVGSIERNGTTVTFTSSEDLAENAEGVITATADEGGDLSTATVYVVVGDDPGPLNVSPSTVELNLEGSVTLTASGGVVPYRFELATGDGELEEDPDGVTAVFTAAAQPGTARIRVYDKTDDFVVAQIKVKRN